MFCLLLLRCAKQVVISLVGCDFQMRRQIFRRIHQINPHFGVPQLEPDTEPVHCLMEPRFRLIFAPRSEKFVNPPASFGVQSQEGGIPVQQGEPESADEDRLEQVQYQFPVFRLMNTKQPGRVLWRK